MYSCYGSSSRGRSSSPSKPLMTTTNGKTEDDAHHQDKEAPAKEKPKLWQREDITAEDQDGDNRKDGSTKSRYGLSAGLPEPIRSSLRKRVEPKAQKQATTPVSDTPMTQISQFMAKGAEESPPPVPKKLEVLKLLPEGAEDAEPTDRKSFEDRHEKRLFDMMNQTPTHKSVREESVDDDTPPLITRVHYDKQAAETDTRPKYTKSPKKKILGISMPSFHRTTTSTSSEVTASVSGATVSVPQKAQQILGLSTPTRKRRGSKSKHKKQESESTVSLGSNDSDIIMPTAEDMAALPPIDWKKYEGSKSSKDSHGSSLSGKKAPLPKTIGPKQTLQATQRARVEHPAGPLDLANIRDPRHPYRTQPGSPTTSCASTHAPPSVPPKDTPRIKRVQTQQGDPVKKPTDFYYDDYLRDNLMQRVSLGDKAGPVVQAVQNDVARIVDKVPSRESMHAVVYEDSYDQDSPLGRRSGVQTPQQPAEENSALIPDPRLAPSTAYEFTAADYSPSNYSQSPGPGDYAEQYVAPRLFDNIPDELKGPSPSDHRTSVCSESDGNDQQHLFARPGKPFEQPDLDEAFARRGLSSPTPSRNSSPTRSRNNSINTATASQSASMNQNHDSSREQPDNMERQLRASQGSGQGSGQQKSSDMVTKQKSSDMVTKQKSSDTPTKQKSSDTGTQQKSADMVIKQDMGTKQESTNGARDRTSFVEIEPIFGHGQNGNPSTGLGMGLTPFLNQQLSEHAGSALEFSPGFSYPSAMPSPLRGSLPPPTHGEMPPLSLLPHDMLTHFHVVHHHLDDVAHGLRDDMSKHHDKDRIEADSNIDELQKVMNENFSDVRSNLNAIEHELGRTVTEVESAKSMSQQLNNMIGKQLVDLMKGLVDKNNAIVSEVRLCGERIGRLERRLDDNTRQNTAPAGPTPPTTAPTTATGYTFMAPTAGVDMAMPHADGGEETTSSRPNGSRHPHFRWTPTEGGRYTDRPSYIAGQYASTRERQQAHAMQQGWNPADPNQQHHYSVGDSRAYYAPGSGYGYMQQP